jgi:hypothetical protein
MELIKTIDVPSIEYALTNAAFKEDISHNLQSWREDYSVVDSDFKETKVWIEKIISDFLELVRDIEDTSELSVTMFTKYIEFKCFWRQLNTQIQYQNFKTGTANTTLIGRASLTTFVLSAMEPLISQSELAEIQDFLMKPINELIRLESNIDITSEENEIALMEAQLDSLYADKEYLQKSIGLTTADEILESIENLESQIRDLKDEFSDSVMIDNKISFLGKRKITIQKQKA